MADEALTQEQETAMWDEEAQAESTGTPIAATAPPAEEPPESIEVAAPATAPANEDPLASLPEVVRAKLARIDSLEQLTQQLAQQTREAQGRVGAMQREMEQSRRAAQAVADAPTQQQIAAAKTPDSWTKLKADFPEWAGAMEEFVDARFAGQKPTAPQIDMSKVADPDKVVEFVNAQIASARAEMGRQLEEARIEGKYEDWKELVKTSDFTAWFQAQPPEVKALADSTKAKDAIRMLDAFHAAKAKPVANVVEDRQRRLQRAATDRPGASPVGKTVDQMSAKELWDYEARRAEQRRAAAG